LSELVDMCRKKGVVRLVSGDIEVVMGPPPQAAAPKDGKSLDVEARRAHYEVQLGRSISDHDLEMLP
jgi:hypothetical protein